MVIFIHISASSTLLESTAGKLINIANKIASPAVPLFIFLSGLTLTMAYGAEKKFEIWSFYRRRLTKIALPYLLWSLFYYVSIRLKNHLQITFLGFIKCLFTGSAAFHLYFIVIILQFYLLFPLVRLIAGRLAPSKWGAVFFSLIGLLISLIFRVLFVDISYSSSLITSYTLFAFAGCAMAYHWDQMLSLAKQNRLFFMLIFVFYVLLFSIHSCLFGQLPSLQISAFVQILSYNIGCFFGLMLVIDLSEIIYRRHAKKCRGYRLLESIGDASFYIYLSHPTVIFATEFFFVNSKLASGFGTIKIMILNAALIAIAVIPLSILYAKSKSRKTA